MIRPDEARMAHPQARLTVLGASWTDLHPSSIIIPDSQEAAPSRRPTYQTVHLPTTLKSLQITPT